MADDREWVEVCRVLAIETRNRKPTFREWLWCDRFGHDFCITGPDGWDFICKRCGYDYDEIRDVAIRETRRRRALQ
jgi:hypothetical protein